MAKNHSGKFSKNCTFSHPILKLFLYDSIFSHIHYINQLRVDHYIVVPHFYLIYLIPSVSETKCFLNGFTVW